MTTLYLAWRQPNRRWWPVGRLTYGGQEYVFAYTMGAQSAASEAGFRPLVSFPDLNEVYVSDELFPLFTNRVLPKGRPDYSEFVRWLDLSGEVNPLALLARSGGQKETDMFEVFPAPVANEAHRYRAVFFIHGMRHYQPESLDRALRLEPHDSLRLEADPANPSDSQALRILSEDGVLLGFVPRYLCGDLHALRDVCPQDVRLTVQRVNSPLAPLQFLVLCSLDACWPVGFTPCSEPEFQPIHALVIAGTR